MNWIIFLTVGAAFMFISLASAVTVGCIKKYRSNRILTPFHLIMAGIFVTLFVMLIPLHRQMCDGTSLVWLKTLLFALQGTMQVFTVDADTSVILDYIPSSPAVLSAVYSGILSVLFVAAPVCTVGFLISFIKNASAYVKFFFRRRRELYVFSELNEQSLTLAKDLHAHHPRAAFLFTGVSESDDEDACEIEAKALEMGGICFRKDILSLDLKLHSPAKAMYLFMIGKDESENITRGLKLIERYGKVKDSHLYVFSTGTESELLLTHNGGIPMKVRRINEARSLIDCLLYEEGDVLFRNAAERPDGEKTIHAVVAGLGRQGTEMVKALTWYCQMDGYHIVIDAFDRDEKAEERFRALCPELMSEEYNGVCVPGEAEYTVRIHSGVDVDTAGFAGMIGAMKDVTYAFAALGSDEANVRAAVDLRMLFERSRIHPTIHAVVRNADEKAALTGIRNYSGQEYDIRWIGDTGTFYSERVILDSKLENEALERHLKWGKEEEFWKYEYNYRSSIASAIHMAARTACGIAGADKPEGELTAEEKAVIEPLEHRRWNAYMRSEGYVYSGSHNKSSRNNLGKMHHDLVDFSSLSEEEKRKDSAVGSK